MYDRKMPRIIRHAVAFCGILGLCSGCGTTQPPAPIAFPQTVPDDVPEVSQEIASQGIQRASLSRITTLPDLTEKPAQDACAVSVVESNTDDGVMIQGKAYIRRTLPELYRDLTTAEVVGPRHITNDFVRDNFVETPLSTSYTLHVKARYILAIEFDLEWRVEPVFDSGKHVGYVAQTHKTSGTKYLTEITNHLQILETEPGLFEVEITSFNRATMNKEAESKAYVVGLFDYWAEACHHAYAPSDEAMAVTQTTTSAQSSEDFAVSTASEEE